MKKNLLVLGGGEKQVPIIQKAKQLGYYVVICDYFSNPPGKLYSDVHYRISTFDYEMVLDVARKEHIDGIVTNSEPVLHVMAKLTDELKLPSVTGRVISLFLEKNLMRDHLEKYGLNTVRYKSCKNIEEAIDFFRSMNRKLIMKPTDSSDSKGVYTVNSEEDINKYFAMSQNVNRRKQNVLLEDYIDGCEFSVDGICIDGRHYSLGIAEKRQFSYNENLDEELYFSYRNDKFDYKELKRINNNIAESTGLPFGMTHAEYKYKDGKFHFIEMAARGGGSFISTLIVPFISGIDTLKILIESSLGEEENKIVEINKQFKNRCAALKFLSIPNEQSGIVNYINGMDALKQKGILKYSFNYKVGDFVKKADYGDERLGYYIAVAETRKELNEIVSNVDKNIVIGV